MFTTIIGVTLSISVGFGIFWLAENVSSYMANDNVVDEELVQL